MQPHARGESDSLAATSNHLPDPSADKTALTHRITVIFGQPCTRLEVGVRYGVPAKDNRCSRSVIFVPLNKNSVSGMKNWLWFYIDSAALWAINNGFQYFSTAAPHTGQA